MIYGIGVDIVKIERIRNAVERWGDAFLRRIFTEKEIKYCYARAVPFTSFAVRFAAKEAFIKAIGSAIKGSLKDIEVANSKEGKPYFKAHGNVKRFLGEKKIDHMHLSLSHEHEFGIAFAVLEGGEKCQ